MPVGVVDDLEVVEIHVHQRQRAWIATIAVQLLAEPLGERAGVQDVRERILNDEARHLYFPASQGLEPRHDVQDPESGGWGSYDIDPVHNEGQEDVSRQPQRTTDDG